MIPNDRLGIHFLNVDHGDCTILRHPGDQHRTKGRISVVDINDWQDRKPDDEETVAGLNEWLTNKVSLSANDSKDFISPEEYAEEYLNDPIEYFQEEIDEGGQNVWRFISTHPHMDHLSGFKRLCDDVGIKGLWDTEHGKTVSEDDDWGPGFDPEDWFAYDEIRSGDTDHWHVQPTQGSQNQYWEDDNIEILHPTFDFIDNLIDNENPNYNNASFVLKIKTRAGSILLPGDAETSAWEDILEVHGEDVLEDVRILKAAHHGRENGFHEEAVEAMDPEYVILSVGKKPSTDAHSDYRDVCSDETEVWSTRQYGCISFTITKRGSLIQSREFPDGIFEVPGE